ncbi:MAG: non-ribosomal peptide synthetase, partial [bacterium]|nr:non-ribosomal peptide synthetase [bacterium]
FPLDYPRPTAPDFEGEAIKFDASQEESAALKKLALAEGVSMYMLISAIYNVLLNKLTNREDIVLGTVVSGRNHPDLERIIGVFVNLLPMRNYPCPEKSFTSFLAEVKANALAAFDNQDYPFEAIVGHVEKEMDVSRYPLLDVGFTFQSGNNAVRSKPSNINTDTLRKKSSNLDINLEAFEDDRGLVFELAYSTALFKTDTIERFKTYFKHIVSAVLKNPDEKLENIEIISNLQKDEIRNDIQKEPGSLEADFEF